jgi:hypothetical protein
MKFQAGGDYGVKLLNLPKKVCCVDIIISAIQEYQMNQYLLML